jgi:hypothetical protein
MASDRRGQRLEIWAPSNEYTSRETTGIDSTKGPILKPRVENFYGFHARAHCFLVEDDVQFYVVDHVD